MQRTIGQRRVASRRPLNSSASKHEMHVDTANWLLKLTHVYSAVSTLRGVLFFWKLILSCVTEQ